jgi:hypothetical protein
MPVKRAIIGSLFALTVLCAVLQCAIDFSTENVACTSIILGSSFVLLLYISWSDALESQPVSTFAIIGFCVTTQLGALFAQTASWTSVQHSLYDPISTFLTLAGYQGIAIGVHVAYRLFSRPTPDSAPLVRGMLESIGLYRTPSAGALWLMGCIGLSSFYLSSFEGALGKVGDALNFLAWAPFLIPIYISRRGDAYCRRPRLHMLWLAAYVVTMAAVAFALNVRVLMFAGVVTVALNYFLIGLTSDSPVSSRALAKMGLAAVVMLALSSPLSYLTTAMAIAHASRGKVSVEVMMDKTTRILQHPGQIEAFRAKEKADSLYSVYDEHYISNPLLARFVETKFHDNALHFAGLLTTPDSQQRLWQATADSLWVTLPDPLINLLDVNVKKAKKGNGLAASTGDFLAYLARGIPLGGYKTGSVFAQGRVLFGPLFPFIYALICVVTFAVYDLLTVRSPPDRPFATALAMMNTWGFFLYGITGDGLDHMFLLFFRYIPQMLLIYALALGLAHLMRLGSPEPAFQPRSLPG